MSLFLSGCNPVLSMKDTANGLKGKVVKKITSASKALDKKLNKKIATINKAIADKDEEIIYDQMSDDLKKRWRQITNATERICKLCSW